MAELLTILGALLLLEGLPYFVFPGRVKSWALTLQEVPDGSLRIMGVISMAAGLVLLYAMRFL